MLIVSAPIQRKELEAVEEGAYTAIGESSMKQRDEVYASTETA